MIQLGIAGAGGYARAWATAAEAAASQVKVAAIWSEDASLANALAGDVGAKVAASFDALLSDPGIQGILIATPTDTHAKLAAKAAAAGKSVLCASPVTLTGTDAGIGGNVWASLPIRFRPEIQHLKQVAAKQELGTVGTIRLSIGRASVRVGGPWYKDAGRSGGALLDVGVHAADAVAYCFGGIERLVAMEVAAPAGHASPYALLTGRAKDGALLHLECSWMETPGAEFLSFEVACAQGLIEYDSRKEPELVISSSLASQDSAPVPELRSEILAFADALNGKADALPSWQNGAAAVALISEALRI